MHGTTGIVIHVGQEASRRRGHNWCREESQGGSLAEHCLHYRWHRVNRCGHCLCNNCCCCQCGYSVVAAAAVLAIILYGQNITIMLLIIVFLRLAAG